jgi:hypothetical protein
MTKTSVRDTLVAIIANLRKGAPDFKAMFAIVTDLHVEVGRWNLMRMYGPGEPTPRASAGVTCVRMLLENLADALSAKDVPTSLVHAEDALLALS